MENSKSVCVIGAGMGGLATVKCMLDAGFDVTCYESNGYVGGRWHKNNQNPIPRTTVTNLPNFFSCYSDFPMPDEFSLYLSADKFSQYFELYAENFGLYAHIKFKHEVINAEPIFSSKDGCDEINTEERNLLKNWKVTYKDENSQKHYQEFDHLIVSSGFYSLPYIPDYLEKTLKNFCGKVIHSIDYIDADEFRDQNVLICGLGNTGGDISVEVSKLSKRTVISTSRGSYIVGRLSTYGKIPVEAASLRVSQYVPSFISLQLKKLFINSISNHVCNLSKLGLVPKEVSSVILNDELPLKIVGGKVEVKPAIKKVDGRNVEFTNGTKIENVDVVILCTGYVREFSFLDDLIISTKKNGKLLPLYKGMFPANNYKYNIAFVGMFSVFGPVAPTSEMQARYIAEVFKENVKLPDNQTMERKIAEFVNDLESTFSGGLKEYNLIHNVWGYLDELAVEIGCRPSLSWLLLTDPVLYWNLFSNYSIHEYRLIGPKKWNGARDAILNKESSRYAFTKGSRENSM